MSKSKSGKNVYEYHGWELPIGCKVKIEYTQGLGYHIVNMEPNIQDNILFSHFGTKLAVQTIMNDHILSHNWKQQL